MTVPVVAALTAGWLAAGELTRRRLERLSGNPRGPLTIACWPVAVTGEALLAGAVRVLSRPGRADAALPAAPLGWQVMRDDGGWLHPEEARLHAAATCLELGAHEPVSDGAGHRRCVRCGDLDPLP